MNKLRTFKFVKESNCSINVQVLLGSNSISSARYAIKLKFGQEIMFDNII